LWPLVNVGGRVPLALPWFNPSAASVRLVVHLNIFNWIASSLGVISIINWNCPPASVSTGAKLAMATSSRSVCLVMWSKLVSMLKLHSRGILAPWLVALGVPLQVLPVPACCRPARSAGRQWALTLSLFKQL
jgi:hypothetical protein